MPSIRQPNRTGIGGFPIRIMQPDEADPESRMTENVPYGLRWKGLEKSSPLPSYEKSCSDDFVNARSLNSFTD